MKLDVRWLAACSLAFAALGAAMWVVVSSDGERAPLAAEPLQHESTVQPVAKGSLRPIADPRELAAPLETPSERQEVAEERPRATLVLKGQFVGARGLGREFEVRVGASLFRSNFRWRDVSGELWPELDESEGEVAPAGAWFESEDEQGLSAQVAEDGSFELEVTALLPQAGPLPSGLVVHFQHENFRSVRADVPFVLHNRPLTRERLARDERIVLPFEWQLEPMSIVRGGVTLSDGEAPVHVEAWRIVGDRPCELLAADSVNGAGDTFELRFAPCAKLAVVAFCDGFLPQTRVVYIADELDLWIGNIALDRGFSYSGQVAIGEHTLGASAWLYLSRENPVFNAERFRWRGFVWYGNRFEPEAAAVRTTRDGSFRFTGLAGGAYELRMGIDPKWWTQMDPVYFVQVPDEGVTLRPALTRVELQVEQGDLPASQRPIAVRGLGRDGASTARLVTDGIGRAQLRLFPGEPYVVSVEQPRGPAWEYGKVTSRERLDAIERISMAAHTSR